MANIAAELLQFYGTKSIRLFLGLVKPCPKKNAARVLVLNHVMDERILMYFEEPTSYYAYDPEKKCKTGDVVLIKELPEKKTTLITHEVLKIIYPLGDVTDPVTGRKVMNINRNTPVYRDTYEKLIKVYGESPNRFKYEKAPPRGWQEGKRDFSDKEIKINITDDGKYDPYQRYL